MPLMISRSSSRDRPVAADEVLEHGVACAVGVQPEHRPIIRTAASGRRPVEHAAGQGETGSRIRPVAAGDGIEHRVVRAVGVSLVHRRRVGLAARVRRAG